jgi:hypothetical protein
MLVIDLRDTSRDCACVDASCIPVRAASTVASGTASRRRRWLMTTCTRLEAIACSRYLRTTVVAGAAARRHGGGRAYRQPPPGDGPVHRLPVS